MPPHDKYDYEERLSVPGGLLGLREIKPKKLFDPVPVLFVPGWGESVVSTLSLAEEFSKLQRQVLILDYTNLDTLPDETDTANPSKPFPATEVARAQAITAVLAKRGIKELDMVAHSEGAIAAMLSTTFDSEANIKIILIAPAGITRQSLTPLALRFLKSFFLQFIRVFASGNKAGRKYFAGVCKYMLLNPLQLARDAYGISQSDIVPLLARAKRNNNTVHIIQNRDDRVFSAEKMREATKDYCVMHTLEGTHDEIYFQPRRFATYIDAILREGRINHE